MAIDFRSKQLRASQIIASGGINTNMPHLGLLFYSSSVSSGYDGTTTVSNYFTYPGNAGSGPRIGQDVWAYFHGVSNNSVFTSNRANGSVVLFGGDVVVSGTLWGTRQVVQVDQTVQGDFIAPNAGYFGGVPENNNSSAPPLAEFSKTYGVFSFGYLSASNAKYDPAFYQHTDSNFHVGGTKGSRNSSTRGTAVFGGDMVVSGNLATLGAFTFTPKFDQDVQLDNATVYPPGIVWKNAATQYGHIKVVNDSSVEKGVFAVTGANSTIRIVANAGASETDAVINARGLNISDGKALYLYGATNSYPNIGAENSSNRKLIFSLNGEAQFKNFANSGLVRVDPGMLIPRYNNSMNPGQDTGITFYGEAGSGTNALRYLKSGDNSAAYSALELTSTTAQVRIRSEAGKVIISGSNGVEIRSDLFVSGAFVKMESINATTKDPVILMASGALSSNQNGGIAIASGSTVSNESLVLGRVDNDTWGVGRKDVSNGSATTLADMTLVSFRANKLELGGAANNISATNNTLQFSGSAFSFQGDKPLYLNEQRSTKFFVSASVPRTVILETDQGLNLDLKSSSPDSPGPYLNFIQGGISGPRIYRNSSVSEDNFVIQNTVGRTHVYSQKNSGAEVTVMAGHPDDNARKRQFFLVVSQSHEQGNNTTLTDPTGFGIIGGWSNDSKDAAGSADWFNTAARQKDIALFISGAIGCVGKQKEDRDIRGAAVFGGDLLVSGNTDIKGSLTVGTFSLDNLTLTSTTAGEPYIRFRDTNTEISRDTGSHLKFKDTQSPAAGAGYTLTQLAALSVTDNTDVFAVTHAVAASAPYLSYVASTGSFSFDHDPTNVSYTARRTNQIGTDVYFFVSGTTGGKANHRTTRTVSVFGGDIVLSGNLVTSQSVGASNIKISAANTNDPTATGGGATTGYPAGSTKIFSTGSSADVIFGTSPSGTEQESFRMLGATGHLQLGLTRKLAFAPHEATMFLQQQSAGSGANARKELVIQNTSTDTAGGTIKISTNVVSASCKIIPTANNTYDLGSNHMRWANVYTGDLHLKNDRGDWTIVEEADYLCVVNNMTGKKYKMMLQPLEDES